MKLTSDAAVNRIIAEGITDFKSLNDFDGETIRALPKSWIHEIPAVLQDDNAKPPVQAANAILAANITVISIQSLLVATRAVKYYKSIARTPND